jgi:hypothetical protein
MRITTFLVNYFTQQIENCFEEIKLLENMENDSHIVDSLLQIELDTGYDYKYLRELYEDWKNDGGKYYINILTDILAAAAMDMTITPPEIIINMYKNIKEGLSEESKLLLKLRGRE